MLASRSLSAALPSASLNDVSASAFNCEALAGAQINGHLFLLEKQFSAKVLRQISRAQALLKSGEPREAVAVIEPIFNQWSDSELIGVLFLKCLFAAHKFPAALALATGLLKLHGENAEVLGLAARSSSEVKRHRDALIYVERELEIEPLNLKALYRRGVFMRKLGLNSEARASEKAAADAVPSNICYQLAYVRGLLNDQDFIEVVDFAEVLLERNDVVDFIRAEVYAMITKASRAQHFYPEAVAAAQKALDADPENGSRYHTLGRTYLDIGEPAQAEPLLRQAVAMTPTNFWFVPRFVHALVVLGQTEEARTIGLSVIAKFHGADPLVQAIRPLILSTPYISKHWLTAKAA